MPYFLAYGCGLRTHMRSILSKSVATCWSILDRFFDIFGMVPESSRNHPGIIRGAFWDHSRPSGDHFPPFGAHFPPFSWVGFSPLLGPIGPYMSNS